jgi:hypothetical protein
MVLLNEHAKVLNFSALKFALSRSEVQIVFLKTAKDFACYFAMFLDCLSVNENIVQIHRYYPLGNEVRKDQIHEGLKGGQGVSQSKEYD